MDVPRLQTESGQIAPALLLLRVIRPEQRTLGFAPVPQGTKQFIALKREPACSARQAEANNNKGGNDELRAEYSRPKSLSPLMRGLGIHKNIPVSDTKLALVLRVGFITFHLTADKLFPVYPRAITGPPKMSLLLEAKKHACIDHQAKANLVHTDDLRRYITSNQQGEMLVQNLNRIVIRLNVTLGQILYCTTNCIPMNLVFQKNFTTNTLIWNRLCHRNDRQQRGMI